MRPMDIINLFIFVLSVLALPVIVYLTLFFFFTWSIAGSLIGIVGICFTYITIGMIKLTSFNLKQK